MTMSWLLKGRLDRSLIRAAILTVRQIETIKKSANSLGQQFAFLSGPIKTLKTTMAGCVAGAIPAMLMLAKTTATSGDQFDKLSQKSGISAKTLSQWTHAANMSGLSTEQFGANILKLNQQIAAAAQGNKSAQLAFRRAGVSIRDSAGNLKTADQVMLEMSNTFKKMPEGIYKSDLAMAIFGKSGSDMIPLLQGGSDAIRDLIKQSDELGMTFSNDDAKSSAEFCDSLDTLKKSARGVFNTIGKQLIPIITPLIQSTAKWISANRELIATKVGEFLENFKLILPQIRDFLTGVFTGINNTANALGGWTPVLKNSGKLFLAIKGIQFATWLTGVSKAALVLSKSFIKLIPVVIKFGVALLANPVGLVIAGIAALVAAGYFLYKNWDQVVKFIKNMWSGVKKFFSDTFSSITSLFDDGFVNGILKLLKNFNPVTLITKAIDSIFKYFTGVSLIDEGSKLIRSFGDGIVNTWNSIKKSTIDVFTGWIPDWVKSGMKATGIDVDAVRANAGLDGYGTASIALSTAVDAHHANGAIVRRRQIAEIGEDGPEAVIPLTKPARGRQLLVESAKFLGLRVTDKNDSNSEFQPQSQSSYFTGSKTGQLSTAITSFDKIVKPQIAGINEFSKKMTDIISSVTNSVKRQDGINLLSTTISSLTEFVKPQFSDFNDLVQKTGNLVANIKNQNQLEASTKFLGLRVTDKNDSNSEFQPQSQSSYFTGSKTGQLSTAITSFDKIVKPQIAGINEFSKKMTDIISSVTNSVKRQDGINLLSTTISSLTEFVKPQFSDFNDLAQKTGNLVANIKNQNNLDKNIFDNLLPKSGRTVIDEMISGTSKQSNTNTTFSPTFNPNITVNCSSNVDEFEKRLRKILQESQNDFAQKFSDFQYNKKRVGVF